MEKKEYYPQLESLRGIAALLVAFSHVGWITPLFSLRLIRNGYSMVDFFFVLSGFVICNSYRDRLRTQTEIGRFVWLRFWRLYPLHFLTLMVFLGFEVLKALFAAHVAAASHPAFSYNTPRAFLANLFLVQALGSAGTTFNWPSWSICTEFFAYLSFAVLATMLRATRSALMVTTAVSVVALLVLLLHGETDLTTTSRLGFFRCLFGFYLGVSTNIAFEALAQRRKAVTAGAKKITRLALLSACAGLYTFKQPGYLDFVAVPLVALLVFSLADAAPGTAGRVLLSKPLVWLGTISYSVYMVHAAVVWSLLQVIRVVFNGATVEVAGLAAVQVAPLVGILFLVPALLLIWGASELTYRWVERPFREWSRRVAARWQNASTTDAERSYLATASSEARRA